jgi:hypothetical protein
LKIGDRRKFSRGGDEKFFPLHMGVNRSVPASFYARYVY